jgi:sulfhydrogenase subunit beta (sulfur reductase)
MAIAIGTARFLPRPGLQALLDLLREDGRRLIGPTVADGAIVYDEIREVGDLPVGRGDEHRPGSYRLVDRGDERCFGYVVGPTSWKRFTFPPRAPISVGVRGPDGTVAFTRVEPEVPRLAFLGVRACELAAIGVADTVFTAGPAVDPDYAARRSDTIIVAVQCTTSATTCFCTSMGTGPEVTVGHDLVLTELDDGFVVETGSPIGERLLARLPTEPLSSDRAGDAATAVAATRAAIGEPVATEGLPDRLRAALDSPRWADVAERCLSCTNCTLVCPTCFCTSVERRTDLHGFESASDRVWDSCFTPGFATVAGGDFRPAIGDRYRQWLTHKFGTWWEQFGTSGCVGCGRCITWCPVGIDVREELAAIAPPQPTVPMPLPEPSRPVGSGTHVAHRIPEDRQAYVSADVAEVRRETADTWTLTLAGLDDVHGAGTPGRFVMVALPEHPPAAISISRLRPPDGLELTIRSAGPATAAITALQPGAQVGVRGPLGAGWPVEAAAGRDVLLVAGGSGLAPLRPLIDALLAEPGRFGRVRLYYGARTPGDLLYTAELAAWARAGSMDVAVTVDRPDETWIGAVGLVTGLFRDETWDAGRTVAYVCGPERMMEGTAAALVDRGLSKAGVYVTLERQMQCGVGLCGHCQMGPFFVCTDGPVFSLERLGDVFGREGI